ncbi:MAG: D-alanine--D-alanine ligase [Deltaproteobacteria bacterium]|nr:D-alanine--D-alanine ligase [Deltaproteobacteria bacterium]
MNRLTVAVLSGGVSAEREISLKSGAGVMAALDKDRYQVRRYDPATDLEQLIKDKDQIDVALIILHGRFGEDGTIQGFLDLLGIPYQSSGVLGCAAAMNKLMAKNIYRQAGLPVAPDLALSIHTAYDLDEIIDTLGLPVVVKPVQEGSSIGIGIPDSREELGRAIETAFSHDSCVLVERYIKGREITGSVLGLKDLRPMPLIEIIPCDTYRFFDYEAKYKVGASREICPAPLDPDLAELAQSLAVRAHLALCCQVYSRTDMMMEDGQIYVLETNTIPGMTETSLFPQAAQAAGLSFPMLLDVLIRLALEKPGTGQPH